MLPNRLICVISLASGLFLLPLLTGCEKTPKTPEQEARTVSETTFEADTSLCNFHQSPCDKKLDETIVSLLINPKNTPSEKPLTVTLSSNVPLDDLQVRVEGRDMFMGVIPVILSETDKNTYQGTLIYGSCSSNYMVWRLIASFKVGGQSKMLMYDFLADTTESAGKNG